MLQTKIKLIILENRYGYDVLAGRVCLSVPPAGSESGKGESGNKSKALIIKSSRLKVFLKKSVLKHFLKIHRKTPVPDPVSYEF